MNLEQLTKFQFSLCDKNEISELSFEKIGKIFIFQYESKYGSLNFIGKILDTIYRVLLKNKYAAMKIPKIIKVELDEDITINNLAEGFKFIAQRFLFFKEEPSTTFLKLKSKAERDIKDLETDNKKLDLRLKELGEQRGHGERKIDEIDYEKYLVQRFIERNYENIADIEIFLRTRIKSYTISQCTQLFGGALSFFQVPYHYAWWPKAYMTTENIQFSNKFRHLPMSIFRKLIKEYKVNNESIYAAADKYIEDNSIVDVCKRLLVENHILYKRKEIIERVLNAYNIDNFIFCNLIFSQIEGLFYEYCSYIGKSENELIKSSISEKAKMLFESGLLHNSYYDYYASVFPIARNRLAHGIDFSMPFDNMAKMLLLDLYHVLELSTDNFFQYNIIIKIMANIEKQKTFENILNYTLVRNLEIDDYYDVNSRSFVLDKEIDWECFLNELYDKCEHWDISGYAKNAAINLKKKNILTDKVISVLKKVGDQKAKENEQILEHLKRYIR